MGNKKYTGDVNRRSGYVDNQKEIVCDFNCYIDEDTYKIGMPSPIWYTKNMIENPTAFYRSRQRRRRRSRG
jgi:hypothetical protein